MHGARMAEQIPMSVGAHLSFDGVWRLLRAGAAIAQEPHGASDGELPVQAAMIAISRRSPGIKAALHESL